MKNIQNTSIPLESHVKIVRNTHGEKEDDCLIGVTGRATNPYASGENGSGWIGIWADNYTAYGYQFNVHESEVKILKD